MWLDLPAEIRWSIVKRFCLCMRRVPGLHVACKTTWDERPDCRPCCEPTHPLERALCPCAEHSTQRHQRAFQFLSNRIIGKPHFKGAVGTEPAVPLSYVHGVDDARMCMRTLRFYIDMTETVEVISTCCNGDGLVIAHTYAKYL